MSDNKQQQPASYLLTVNELSELTGIKKTHLKQCFDEDLLITLPGNQSGIPGTQVKQYFRSHGIDYRFRSIAHINLKGGVGKTTSTISLATRAAQYGFRTCILDLDSQGSATLAFGFTPADEDPVFIDVWQKPEELLIDSLEQIQENLYLLPSSLENGLLDQSLANPSYQKHAMRNVCQTLQQYGFDLVFIDCPPSLGAAVIATACAADIIVVPVSFDAFSQKGLLLTQTEIRAICDTFGLPEPELNILYTFFDRRVKQSLSTLTTLQEQYPQQLIPVPIRTTTQFSKASVQQQTIFATTARSSAKEDYDRCLRHLLDINSECFAATEHQQEKKHA